MEMSALKPSHGGGFEELNEEAVTLQTGQGQNPGGDGGTDVGTHDYAYCLIEGQKSGIYETNHHYRGGRRGLYNGRDAKAREHALEGVGGHGGKKTSQFVARGFLQARTHQVHAVEEHAQCSQ